MSTKYELWKTDFWFEGMGEISKEFLIYYINYDFLLWMYIEKLIKKLCRAFNSHTEGDVALLVCLWYN